LGPKRIIAASILLALVIAALGAALAVNQLISVRGARAWVTHTHDVIDATRDVETMMVSAESAGRGYILTRRPQFIPQLQSFRRQTMGALDRLQALVADNPEEVGRVQELRVVTARRLAFLNEGMSLAQAGREAELAALTARSPGVPVMAEFRSEIGAIRAGETRLLNSRLDQARRNERVTLVLGLALAGTALAALLALVVTLARANRRLSMAIAASEEARQAQAASDALSAAMFVNVPDYLMVLDVTDDGRFVIADLNPAFQKALRTSIDQVRGRSIDELLPAPAANNLIDHYRRVLASDRPVLTRSEIPVPGGERPLTWESILAPIHDAAGAPRRIIGSVRDITERVAAEERLRTSQRMEAIGQLTGGVAHDFNNLLQVIRGNIELLEPVAQGNERASRRLASALHGVDRAAQLTRQLLAYARRQPLEPRPINLGRLVGDMGDMLRRTLGEAVEVETVVAGGLWNTIADPAQVESAVLNLAINARDAMPEGGRLTIEMGNAVLDESYVRQALDVSPGQYVMIAVTDTGQGMAPETAARVFEPFFTTKSEGQGTGLGLSMVYGFVKQSNGHVLVYS
jgi:PAS domain S-box-containing protein